MEIRKTELFARWLDRLKDPEAKAKVLVRIARLADGNPGDVKSVGKGVSEMRIPYGPGYRSTTFSKGISGLSCWPEEARKPNRKTFKPPSH